MRTCERCGRPSRGIRCDRHKWTSVKRRKAQARENRKLVEILGGAR